MMWCIAVYERSGRSEIFSCAVNRLEFVKWIRVVEALGVDETRL